MKSKSVPALIITALAALTAACSAEAGESADDYPSDDIRVIVPFAAGGPTDVTARVPAQCMEDKLGTTFVVENKPGGGGAIGASELARSDADGYTLGTLAPATVAIAPVTSENAGYSSDDFTFLGTVFNVPSGLMVPADSAFDTAQDFLDAATAEPGSVSVATAGASTPFHIEMTRLSDLYDVPLQVVPFEGGAPALNAMQGGSVDALFAGVTVDRVAAWEDGDIKILFTGSSDSVAFLPEVPTLVDLGFPELVNTDTFIAYAAPAGTPAETVQLLSSTLESCLADEEVRQTLGEDYVPSEFAGPEATGKRMATYVENFAQILDVDDEE